jgi:nucleoside transporter
MSSTSADAAGDFTSHARRGTAVRLSIMMFLEFFIWGAWLPLIFGYLTNSLHYTANQAGWVMSAFAIASFVGMFFSNQFADRNFSAERFMAVSHLIGGVAVMLLTWTQAFWPFFGLMLLYCLFYVPTMSIANSITFAHLKDSRDFGLVRLWGTIGWIAASWPFVFILVDWGRVPAFSSTTAIHWLGSAFGASNSGAAAQFKTRYIFLAAGIASLLLAAFSLMLPHTPPKPARDSAAGGVVRERYAWLEAIRLLKVPFVLVLFIVTFFDSAVQQGYFLLTGDYLQFIHIPANWVMMVMSIGQVAEIAAMAALGYVLKRLGWRTTLVLGILGHTLRFTVFALAPVAWLAVSVIIIHGICYAFFFAAVYIFVDEFFPKDARSSAQGLFNFLILGLGPLVANFGWPMLAAHLTVNHVINYRHLMLVPAGTALFAAILLLLFFHPPQTAREPAHEAQPAIA